MAFITVNKLRAIPANVTEPVVTMGAYLADGKKHKTKSVNMRFTAALIEQLSWEFPDGALYIVINEGIDADKGFLQIVCDPTHPQKRRCTKGQGRQGFSVSTGMDSFKHYVLNECPVPANTVQHIIDGSALIVECPDWLRYNPESVPKPPPEPVQLHPGRGHRRQRG